MMLNRRQAELDPAHILAICARATGGRRGLAVRNTDGIIVCILPSRRTAYRSSTALARVGYEVTTVSAGRGRDLLVTGWDLAALETRLATMRTVLHQLADTPPATAKAVIEWFRDLPVESRTHRRQWELLNQARTRLDGWVASRSGIHALRSSAIEPSDGGVTLRLRAAVVLEQAIDAQVERQLRFAGHALALFRRLSDQTDADTAQDTAIRWAGITFHLGNPAARDTSHLMPRPGAPAQGTVPPDHQAARTFNPAVGSIGLGADSPSRPGWAGRTAAEFPRAAITAGRPVGVVPLDSARRGVRPGPKPRLRP
jgi:hypothetical protein